MRSPILYMLPLLIVVAVSAAAGVPPASAAEASPVALAAPNAARDMDPIVRAEDEKQVDAPAIQAALVSRLDHQRIKAAIALGRILDPRGIDPLLALLGDPSLEVRRAAIFSLGQFAWKPEFSGGRETELVARLQPLLAAARPAIRRVAAEAIGKLGMEAVPALVQPLLGDTVASVRAEALMALARYRLVLALRKPGTQVAPLSDALSLSVRASAKDPDVRVRRAASYALARAKDARAVSELAALSRDEDVWARFFAVTGLGKMPVATATASPTDSAAAALADRVYVVRVAAIQALQALKAADRIPAAKLVHDPVYHVREALAQATTDEPTLEALLADASPAVRSAALSSIAKVRKAAALPLLQSALKDSDWVVRLAAVDASSALDTAAQEAFLGPALADSDVRVRSDALEALGSMTTPTSLAAILKALGSTELSERGSAADALTQRAEPEALAAAWRAYLGSAGEKWTELREGLIDFIAKTRSDETTAELRQALADPASSVSAKAYQALKDRGISGLPQPTPPQLTYSPYRELSFRRDPVVLLRTTKGRIWIRCFAQAAPVHVANFVGFAEKGGYDGLPWHRVVPNFVVQGGDPDGTGWGSAGWSLRAEINGIRYERGTVGMPRSDGFDTGGVQLFVTHVPTPNLDGQYTVFGRVVRGFGVLDRIEVGDRILSARVYR